MNGSSDGRERVEGRQEEKETRKRKGRWKEKREGRDFSNYTLRGSKISL